MPEHSDDRSRYFLALQERFHKALEGRKFDEVMNICAMVDALFAGEGGNAEDPVAEQADFFDMVAPVLSSLDQAAAEHLYQRSLQIRQELFGEKHALVAVSLDHLSAFYREIGRAEDGQKFEERATRLYEACLEEIEATVPALIARCEYGRAMPAVMDACRITARLHGARSIEHAQWLNNLAYLYKRVAQELEQPEYFPPAEHYYRTALEIFRRVHGEGHPELAAPLNNLGQLCQAIGKLEEAQKLLEQALQITQRADGEAAPSTAGLLNNLANLAEAKGEMAAAERLHLKALEIRRKAQGENHPLFAQSLNNLAMIYKAQGRWFEAEPLFLRALQINGSIFGEHHPDTLRTGSNLVDLYKAMGNEGAADKLMGKMVEGLQEHAERRPYVTHLFPEIRPLFVDLVSSSRLETTWERIDVEGNEEVDPQRFQELLRECVASFTEQRYSDCFREAMVLNALHPTHEVLQVYVVCVQMLMAGAESAMSAFVGATEKSPWWNTLIKVTLGMIRIEDAVAPGQDEQCQLHYYAGIRYLVEGDPEAARKEFGQCLKYEVDLFERRMAERMQHASPAAAARDAQAQVARLNSRVSAMLRRRSPEAVTAAAEALAIASKDLPEDSRAFRVSLYNVAAAFYFQGEHGEARRYFEQLVALLRRDSSPDATTRGAACNGVGLVYLELGHHALAEQSFREAIESLQKAGKGRDPLCAQALGNLAEAYRERSDFGAAAPLYEAAIDIMRHAEAEERPEYGRWLTNFGILYMQAHNLSRAEELISEGLHVREESLPDGHPEIASSLLVMANLYILQRRWKDAEETLLRTLSIFRGTFGEGHFKCLTTNGNLASVKLAMNKRSEGEDLLRRTLQGLEGALPESHAAVRGCRGNLACLLSAVGRPDEAMALLEKNMAAEEELRQALLAITSERQRMIVEQQLFHTYSAFLTLICANHGRPDLQERAFDVVLRRKGTVAEVEMLQRNEIVGSENAEQRRKFAQLHEIRSKLGRKLLGGIGREGKVAHEEVLSQWIMEKEQLEAELARASPEMALIASVRAASRRAVAMALPAGSALIEFVRFEQANFEEIVFRKSEYSHRTRYIAFVLRAGDGDHLQLFDLGDADLIDRMTIWNRELITRTILEATSILPGEMAEDATQFRQVIFDPLITAIGEAKRLFIAPDGELSTFPFEVLPCDETRSLIDEYDISYVTCGRDVIRFGAQQSSSATSPCVIAAPTFDLGADEESSGEPVAVNVSRDLGRSGLRFGPLPGTVEEGQEVARMLNVKPIIGDAALKSTVKAIQSPLILHMASHGFFLPNQKGEFLPSLESSIDPILERLSSLENPLLRSGIALAGANAWLDGKAPRPGIEDGILTAEDVTSLNLASTEMVVLSACESGLGQVYTGQGVFGLRRAFMVAGAKTLVMSLWKTPDAETQSLMIDFYRRLLNGESRSEALLGAKQAMRTKHGHPFFWGGFVLQGEPGPLSIEE